jgi:hypothetical protein
MEFAAAALATKSMTPTKPIPNDLINITNQKRECGEECKIQLANFDKASLRRFPARADGSVGRFAFANVIALVLDNTPAACTLTRGTGQAGLCPEGNRF